MLFPVKMYEVAVRTYTVKIQETFQRGNNLSLNHFRHHLLVVLDLRRN